MIAAMNFLYKVGSPMETKKQTRKTSSKTKELILEVTREIAAEKGVAATVPVHCRRAAERISSVRPKKQNTIAS